MRLATGFNEAPSRVLMHLPTFLLCMSGCGMLLKICMQPACYDTIFVGCFDNSSIPPLPSQEYGPRCRQHNGFRELDLMDDLDLVMRLRRHEGQPIIVPAPVVTSARRWQKLGLARTTVINQALVLAWMAGVPHHTLAKIYHGAAHGKPKQPPRLQLPRSA